MTQQERTELQELVDDFATLKIKERSGKTFLEIANVPHLENVWSNILAFYLNPKNEHNLFDLILKSVLETAGKPLTIDNFENISVKTEYPTKLGKRIDIVVFAENFILGIENKVNAGLYNDLEDYSNTIDDLAKPSLVAYKIVLSKNKNNPKSNFINITYSDLIRNIKKNIGDLAAYSDTKYLLFLFDFLKNIENNINSQSMADNLNVINFFHENIDKVNKLLKYRDKVNSDLVDKMGEIYLHIKQEEIKTTLPELGKENKFVGSGLFTSEGSKYIKYNIVVNGISLFFQVGIEYYKLVSYYWFDPKDKYKYMESKLKNKGVKRTDYKYGETPEDIAAEITRQIKIIISIFDDEKK